MLTTKIEMDYYWDLLLLLTTTNRRSNRRRLLLPISFCSGVTGKGSGVWRSRSKITALALAPATNLPVTRRSIELLFESTGALLGQITTITLRTLLLQPNPPPRPLRVPLITVTVIWISVNDRHRRPIGFSGTFLTFLFFELFGRVGFTFFYFGVGGG